MTNLIVIHSDGPMGSTALGSLFEAQGYLTYPIRKICLEDYILGKRDLNDTAIKLSIIRLLKKYSKPLRVGGTSVKNRNESKELVRTTVPSEIDLENFLNERSNNIKELIIGCYDFFSKHVVYKQLDKRRPIRGYVLYTLPLSDNEDTKNYLKGLSDIDQAKVIVLSRDYSSWVAALCSQQDSQGYVFNARLKTRLSKLKRRLDEIGKLQKKEIFFQYSLRDILEPNTIRSFTNLLSVMCLSQENDINYRELKYDHYGSILDFNSGFIQSDRSYAKASWFTKHILNKARSTNHFVRLISDGLFILLRLFNIIRF